MKPIGPLMQEHRLIERMVSLLKGELKHLSQDNTVDAEFLTVAIDFVRTYADRTHHGKEEDILFRELARKQLSRQHERTMAELVEEHGLARRMVANLVGAMESYATGDVATIKNIAICVEELVDFYPPHIEKEDKHFFHPALGYLSGQEQDAMLQEFREFDRKLIHEKYGSLVEGLERRQVRQPQRMM